MQGRGGREGREASADHSCRAKPCRDQHDLTPFLPFPLSSSSHQIPTVLALCQPTVPQPVAEAALRCLVSLSYCDRISVPLVVEHGADLLSTLVQQTASTSGAIQRYAVMTLTNLAVHDFNKVKIVEAGGGGRQAGPSYVAGAELRMGFSQY